MMKVSFSLNRKWVISGCGVNAAFDPQRPDPPHRNVSMVTERRVSERCS